MCVCDEVDEVLMTLEDYPLGSPIWLCHPPLTLSCAVGYF